ncbi:MAG: hypothetical protein E7184_02255 [Erysipelotrichaceae bacterium]|nr:hypothetical protein [Erysipelotrichaceae bacterium]
MKYTFLWKNKRIKVIPDTNTIPVSYYMKSYYGAVIDAHKDELLDKFIDHICNDPNYEPQFLSYKRKLLNPIHLKKEMLLNPRIEKGKLSFELASNDYMNIKAINRNNISYYDMSDNAPLTFEIDLRNIATNILTKKKEKFDISYFPNTFLEGNEPNENYKYIQVDMPLFGKTYKMVAYHDNDYSDVETIFSATATNMLLVNSPSKKMKHIITNKSYNFPLKKSFGPDDEIKFDYCGLFKYYQNIGTEENPEYRKFYLKLPSRYLFENGKYFMIDSSSSSFYQIINSDLTPTNQQISGIEVLDYIRHNISRSYKNYENVGVSEDENYHIGYPRTYNIIQSLSESKPEDTYLIPAPVYSAGKYFEDEKKYDNSDYTYPDCLGDLMDAKNPERLMKYHHNRGLFFIEAAIDINSYKAISDDYNRAEPRIKLTKDNQLQVHYGHNDFIKKDGHAIPYVKKLPFQIGTLNQAKNHARKVNQAKEKKYTEEKRIEQFKPWEFDKFDQVASPFDYTIEMWKENFLSEKFYKEWKEDFIESSELENKNDLYLIPLPKDDSKDLYSIAEYAEFHIGLNHPWYCKVSTMIESDLKNLDASTCSILGKANGYDYISTEQNGKYILGVHNHHYHPSKTHILKVVNEEELNHIKKIVYNKWINNVYSRKY